MDGIQGELTMKSKYKFTKQDLWNCDVTFWNWAHERVAEDSPSMGAILHEIIALMDSGRYYMMVMSEKEQELFDSVQDAFKTYLLASPGLLMDFCEFVAELLRRAKGRGKHSLIGNPSAFTRKEWKDLLTGMYYYFGNAEQVERSALDEFFKWLPHMWD